MWFIIPTLVLYVIIAAFATFVFKEYTLQILLGMIVLVVISNMFQSRLVNQKVRDENLRAQDLIREHMGNEKFELLIKAQEDHYQEYFKFNEQQTEENTENQEVIEEKNDNEDKNNDGTKSN
jgi:uncharacterized membrane protein YraQ (UPF0718 family)